MKDTATSGGSSIDSVQARYRDVCVLRPGRFTATDGTPVVLDQTDLARIADNFDPGYLLPTVNIDHVDSGPALGWVEQLNWDGEYLRADIAGVPDGLAQQIDAGAYPSRSAELYMDIDGCGPHLRAVALLGARQPAVKGLPPMGPVAAETSAGSNPAQLAQSTGISPVTPELSVSNGAVTKLFYEVSMDKAKAPAPAAKTVALAEENQRLLAENRRLKHAEQQREVTVFLDQLRAAGKLTPGMELAGVEQLLLAAGGDPLVVRLGEGQALPLTDVLKRILAAVPAGITFGELDPAAEADAGPELSADEKHVAAQLGLTEQEFSEIRQLGRQH